MKLIPLVGGTLALVVSAGAFGASAPRLTSRVTASTSPRAAGSVKKPVPVRLTLDLAINAPAGARPPVARDVRIAFAGVRFTGSSLPACRVSAIRVATSDSVCPRGSQIGSGVLETVGGGTLDTTDTTLPCTVAFRLHNAKRRKAIAFFAATSPGCPFEIADPVPAAFVRVRGGDALQLTLPPTVLHPAAGLDFAPLRLRATLGGPGRKGRGRGAFASTGGCVKGRRTIAVTLMPEPETTPATTTPASSTRAKGVARSSSTRASCTT